MPIIATVDGVDIKVNKEKGVCHHKPHIHAEIAEFEASIELNGAFLAGTLPRNKRKKIINWIVENSDMLQKEWDKYNV